MSTPVPVAQGNLFRTPLIHVLVHVEQRALTGTLAIWPEGPEEGTPDRVYFHEGHIERARLAAPAAAIETGLLALFARHQAPYAFYEADVVGEGSAVLHGNVDVFALVAAALRGTVPTEPIDQVLDVLGVRALRMRVGVDISRFQLQPKELQFLDLLRAAPSAAPTLIHLWKNDRQSRRLIYLLAITKSVEHYSRNAEHPSQSHREERERAAVAPPPTAAAIASSRPPGIRSSGPPRIEIPAEPVAPPPQPSRPSYEGARRRSSGSMRAPSSSSPPPTREEIISSVPPPRPKIEAPSGAPPPPPDLSPELAARWSEVASRALRMDNENFFEMLEIDSRASRELIRERYIELVKRWHPDRLPPELAGVRPWAERIFSHLTDAEDTLSDNDKRAEYHRAVLSGGGTPASDRHVHSVVEAAIEFRKVEVFERRRAYDEALESLRGALRLHDEDPDFHAMKAWILFQKFGLRGDHETEMTEALDRAFELNPDAERANYLRGLILKLQGHGDQALFFFRRVVQNNPRHIDAAREVRIATMRGHRPSSHPPPQSPPPTGLLKKFFKK